jgi:hypothetical protein
VWKILQLRQEYSNDEDILITHTKFSNYFKRQEYIEDILMSDILISDIYCTSIFLVDLIEYRLALDKVWVATEGMTADGLGGVSGRFWVGS